VQNNKNAEVHTVSVAPVQSPVNVKDQVSAAEWQTRVDLAACYRLVALHGWDDLIFTHISAKVPGTEDFLINPFGLMFHEITASSLVKVDQAGNKLMDSPYEINPPVTPSTAPCTKCATTWCVLHTHTPSGVGGVGAEAGRVADQPAVAVRAVEPGLSRLRRRGAESRREGALQADLGENNFLMLHNHGLLTCGGTIADTFLMMFTFQRACDIQVMAQTAALN
jgi:ribulose-5-phosphate 4-epimerase/fuculose-1-phosphate aldolase